MTVWRSVTSRSLPGWRTGVLSTSELATLWQLPRARVKHARMPRATVRRAIAPPEIDRDANGFIKTGMSVAGAPAWQANKHQPSPLETSLPGIFAAGDVRSGSVKRCAAAVGEGGMAIAGVQIALAASAERS